MMVVPIAIAGPPIGVAIDPIRMMVPDPSGVIVMPPAGVVPRVVIVPITIVVRMGDHWRKREQRGQRCGAEYRSKFHS